MIRAALVTMCCAQCLVGAANPVVRAAIDSSRPIIVGQAVHLNVTVLVPNYFTGAVEFPQINVDNAIVVLPQETPRNSNETIAEQSFAGIGVTYVIYPQQPGTFRLSPAEIAVQYASDPPKSVKVRLPLPSVSFESVIPPQAADLDYFLPTSSLVITQKFDRPWKDLKVGDTLTRTVTITAARLRAMLIPPTEFKAPDGIVIYPKQPAVDDIKTDRAEFVQGKRVDSATYLIQKEGDYTLPEIRIEWWNLVAGKVQRATLPAIHFTAAPNPAALPELAPEPEPVATPLPPRTNQLRRYLHLVEFVVISLMILGLLLWAWFRFGTGLRDRWNESRRARKNSEAAYFSKLRTACRSSSAKEAYPLLLAWLNRFVPGVPLSRFLSNVADAELTREVESLTSGLYGSSVIAWSGSRMIAALQRVRTRSRQETRHRPILPPLNPATPHIK